MPSAVPGAVPSTTVTGMSDLAAAGGPEGAFVVGVADAEPGFFALPLASIAMSLRSSDQTVAADGAGR